jgi:hypothetical protein
MKRSWRLGGACVVLLAVSFLACDGAGLPIRLPRAVSPWVVIPGSCCAGGVILVVSASIFGRSREARRCPKCGRRLQTVRYIEDPDMYRHEIHRAVICPHCDPWPEHELPWWIR